jgi:hypothetical protein
VPSQVSNEMRKLAVYTENHHRVVKKVTNK